MKITKNYPQNILLIAIGLIVFFSSCLSRKQTVMMQETDKSIAYKDTFNFETSSYILKTGDAVGLEVFSFNPQVVLDLSGLIKQQSNTNMNQVRNSNGSDIFYLSGYTLDDSGNISIPMVGNIQIGGLTFAEASMEVQRRLGEYYKDVFVKVNFGGIRFTIFGEVRMPGKYTALQSRMNLFEVLAIAGDFSDFAKRDKVHIIRNNKNGAKTITVNLLDKNILKSPYFFIETNDIIYIEPLTKKYTGFGLNAGQGIATVFSAITMTFLVLNFFK